MVFANAINRENIVEASVLEIFESHREQRPPIRWRANATEPGNVQEWGDFTDTTSIGLLNNYVLEPISPIELSQFWISLLNYPNYPNNFIDVLGEKANFQIS